jgi:hypothetical protein
VSEILGGVFGAIVRWLLGLFFGKKEPTAADRAAEAATAETQLDQEEAANAVLRKGADARARVDRDVVLGNNGPPGAVNTDPDAPVNRSEDANFRDD